MKTVSAALVLAATVQAGGVVQWDIHKKAQVKSRLGRRAAKTFEEVITNEQTRGGYFATCTLGTPGQDLTLQLDTGSSDIWVPYTKAEVCADEDTCTLGTCTWESCLAWYVIGTVRELTDFADNPDSSSSFVDVGKGEFNISYVDGSFSTGDYFSDRFSIGGANISNVTMGLGIDTNIPYGLVGVGYALNEAIVNQESSSAVYANLPVSMVNEGLINTNAYSLWLNDLDSSTGNILFGGIDTEKYKGELTRIQVYPDPSTRQFTSFIVALTSLQAVSTSGTDSLTTSETFPLEVVLDSGTTLTYLPNDLAQQVWSEVGAIYSASAALAVLPCSMQDSAGYFSFGLAGVGGPVINVTMDELVFDLTDPAPTFSSGQYEGQDACGFGIQNLTSVFLLGDTFLRSAYVVYDLVNNEIGIAPTNFNATESNIVAFESAGAPIPSATVAPSQTFATSLPSATEPALAAATGFEAGADKSSAATILGQGHMAITGVAMVFAMIGSGLFFF